MNCFHNTGGQCYFAVIGECRSRGLDRSTCTLTAGEREQIFWHRTENAAAGDAPLAPGPWMAAAVRNS